MRIAVLSGGRSSEHDVSLRSGEAVARGLEEAGPVAIVVEDARLGHPGAGRNFARREAGHTLLAQELEGGGHDR